MNETVRRDVRVTGATAFARIHSDAPPVAAPRHLGPIDITPQFRLVKDAVDMDREIGNPGDSHVCPLCEDAFGWEAFKAHAPHCIEARAPRRRVWTPPGMLANPTQTFPDVVHIKGIGDY